MGYPIQMFSVIRPVSEAVNLIELFAAKPELADEWAAGDYRKFAPAKVRETLGIDKDDMYSWMCEHSHPRFAGFQITTYNVIRKGEKKGHGVMKLGELSFDFPAALLATVFPGLGLLNLIGAAGHAVVRKETALRWPTVTRQAAESLRPGFETVWNAVTRDRDEGDEALAEMLAGLDKAITNAREMEAIVADETA